MSETLPPDREVGGEPSEPADDRRDRPTTTLNQPFSGESNSGDSSGPLFSIYSKAAEDEDNNMVERWQKDAEGILIFTGLFSAAVAAFLAVTVQDLRPNSQDTSAFYLGNIYQVLADPNATRPSIPSPPPTPPSFSPSRNAVWVNTLWFLSLVMSLSCALWATSLQQWARRYLHHAQPARVSPEIRARMRAFFFAGVEKMHIPLAVEGLPMLLHLSLFLFFSGLAIFLSNINHEVFLYVICWIGLFFLVYGLITLLPIFWNDSPYHSPLSTPAWFLYAGMLHVTFKVITSITSGSFGSVRTWERCVFLRDRYQRWMLGGVRKAAEEMAQERSSEIDAQILEWTMSALGDDDSLKSFFEAIPGFFGSQLVKFKGDLPEKLLKRFGGTLAGFLGRTWTSNSIDNSEKDRRLDIFINALNQIHDRSILGNILSRLRDDEVPQTVEMGHTLVHWCADKEKKTLQDAKRIIAGTLVSVRERDDNWIALASRGFGLSERVLRDNIALGGDNVLLAILIHHISELFHDQHHDFPHRVVSKALFKFDIHNTHPRVQHDFCALWNEVLREARNLGPPGPDNIQVKFSLLLREIRQFYIALHQGTDAAPTEFDDSTDKYDVILYLPSSYPSCNLVSHRPKSIPPLPTQPSNPPTTSTIGATPHGHDVTPPIIPVLSSSRPTNASPVVAVTPALQYIPATATLSRSLEDSHIVAPSAEQGTLQILSTTSTHIPTPTLVLIPPNTPYDADIVSVPNPSHFAPPIIGSSHPTGSATLPRPRARGLVDNGNMCFANAVLQLLVNSPPFWNLFRELDDLKRQRGARVPDTGGVATPLLDATVRFLKEFKVEEEPPSAQQQPQPATTSMVEEKKKHDNSADSFEPTYLYDAMKGKRTLKLLLDGQLKDAEEFLSVYLDALDKELPALLPSISGTQSASALLDVEKRELSQSDQTEPGNQGIVTNYVKSPITHIFGGKFRWPVPSPNQNDLIPTEEWRSLHLDIKSDSILSVEDALLHVSQSQSIQDGSSGSGDGSQQMQMLIEALPLVLVLHLKRFQYDVTAGGLTKIGKSIQFGPDLEIPPDVMVPNTQQTSTATPQYKLYGVLYHHGESTSSGHYTVDILHQNEDGGTGENWLHIDNEVVSPMRHEDIFAERGTVRPVESDERCAYLLIYCRTSQ